MQTRASGGELMPVFKRKYGSGKTVWRYMFSAPGSTAQDRRLIGEVGFASKQEAVDGEAKRRIEELQKYELARAGATTVAAALPTTFAMLLQEFFRQHAEEKLAPKTIERYREMAAYLAPELLAMPLGEITALHLNREWNRLLKSGGHHRKSKQARPLSAKTVRHVAGLVSSAFTRAQKWGLVTSNPVTHSEPPVPKKHRGIALTPAQQALVFESATGSWCMATLLEVSAATGARRDEVLALCWSDIQDGRAIITRSLTQTRQVLEFKGTKSERPRDVKVPASALAALDAHRRLQNEFREQFGPDYWADIDLIFANPDGTPLRPNSVSSAVSLLFRRLGLPKGASLHSLRHSHGSHLVADGVPLPVVSERLGHSSVRTTADVYAHALRGQDDEAALRWDEFQRRGTGPRPERKLQ
jgi:integrase